MPLPTLSLLDTRVIGVLVEKQHTVPDTYPLTLNALLAGCNQKTSREPILSASEAEVQATIDHLRSLSLVIESSGGRVMRYAHNVERVLARSIAGSRAARGADAARPADGRRAAHQYRTAASFRRHVSTVEAFLQELAGPRAGALVVELPRQAGSTRDTAGSTCSPGPRPWSLCRPAAPTDDAPMSSRSPRSPRSKPTSRTCSRSWPA